MPAIQSYDWDKLTVIAGRLSLSILTVCVVILIAGSLFPQSIHNAFSGTEVVHRDSEPNYIRNVFELLFFISGTAVFITGFLGLYIASKHAEHVKHQNSLTALAIQATTYSNLYNSLFTTEVIEGLDICTKLRQDFQSSTIPPAASLAEYSSDQMRSWEVIDPAKSVTILRLLAVVENIGLLVRRRYVSLDDVYYIYEGPLKEIDNVCRVYLEFSKDTSPDGRMCEHALWLLDRIGSHTPEAGSLLT